MSLDIYLEGKAETKPCECPHCYNEHTREEREYLYDRNITHNLTQMADKAGVYYAMWRPEEKKWFKAKDLIKPLEKGLKKLLSDPAHFKQYNPDNGWGDYEGLVSVVSSYLEACRDNPEADIHVSR